MNLKLLIVAVVMLLVAVFSVQNPGVISVRFLLCAIRHAQALSSCWQPSAAAWSA